MNALWPEDLQFGVGCWYATARGFFSADSGERDTISLSLMHAAILLEGSEESPLESGVAAKRSVLQTGHEESCVLICSCPSRTEIDVGAGAAAFFFHFGEIGALVPVGFGVVVVGDGVEARGFSALRGR